MLDGRNIVAATATVGVLCMALTVKQRIPCLNIFASLLCNNQAYKISLAIFSTAPQDMWAFVPL